MCTQQLDAGVAVEVGDAQHAPRGRRPWRSRRRRPSRPTAPRRGRPAGRSTASATAPSPASVPCLPGRGRGPARLPGRRCRRSSVRAGRPSCPPRADRFGFDAASKLGAVSTTVAGRNRRGEVHTAETTRGRADGTPLPSPRAAARARRPCRTDAARPRRAAPAAHGSTPGRWSATRPTRSSPPPAACSASWAWTARRCPGSPPRSGSSSRRSTTTSATARRSSPRSWPRPTSSPSSSSTGSSPTAARRRRSSTASCAATWRPCAPCPFDINEIHRIAARDRERFAGVLEGASPRWSAGWRRSSEQGIAARRAARPVDAAAHRADDHGQRRGRPELVPPRVDAQAPRRSATPWRRWSSAGCSPPGSRSRPSLDEVSTHY